MFEDQIQVIKASDLTTIFSKKVEDKSQYITKSPETLNKVRFLDIYMSGHKGFIAGGCFKNIFKDEKVKDIDMFFRSEKDFLGARDHYHCSEDYVFAYENKNTIAFKNIHTGIIIELVFHTYGSPQEILNKFDFSITKMAYYKQEDGVYDVLFHADFFEHLMCNKLVLEKDILFPISTFYRAFRYNKYGYGLCGKSALNLLEAVRQWQGNMDVGSLYFGID